MSNGLRLRHLTFHGPAKGFATVSFSAGLNVIFGASNTGKSFIVDTIDFMLGGKGPLRDIPERIGYNQVLLAIETLDGDQFTIVRSTDGGAFRLFSGLYFDKLPEDEGVILSDTHSDRNEENLSAFLLAKIDLAHKRVRRNKRGDTNSLSFRNLARLIVINEEEIIQQRSPLSDGNYTADTTNTSVFKLLLTGGDDSAIAVAPPRSAEEHSRNGQLDLLEQLIDDHRRKVKELAGPPEELEDQRERLENSMRRQGELLAVSESAFRSAATRRREIAKKVEDARDRLTEITTLLDRFTLLASHYRSDVERLRGIEEAGSLFGALDACVCPFCGAAPENHRHSDCDFDTDKIVAAAQAEIRKIESRQSELSDTIASLRKESVSFERRLPGLEEQLASVAITIDSVVSPNLRQLRTAYKELADKDGEVREALAIYRNLSDLQQRKEALEREDANANGGNSVSDTDIPSTVADKFSGVVLDTLKAWHFPEIDRVHFDSKTRDLVINGKNRTSFGKGLRAITQAAFTISLMQYCRQFDTPHPGFSVLDSPLLSYREPEGEGDDLRDSDLNKHFYGYLAKLKTDRQVIVIENTDPPMDVQQSDKALKFTGKAGEGRFGLFPVD
nr:DNA double-strand break repair ATPase Rad50 [Rhizobium sp. Khangiran2]